MKKLKPMRVLVCGGRDYGTGDDGAGWARLVYNLNVLSACGRRAVTVIHSGARGADSLAGQWAANTKTPCEVYRADWEMHGKAAGPLRNTRMLVEGKPDLVLAFPGGKGTANMVEQASRAGVKVFEVTE